MSGNSSFGFATGCLLAKSSLFCLLSRGKFVEKSVAEMLATVYATVSYFAKGEVNIGDYLRESK